MSITTPKGGSGEGDMSAEKLLEKLRQSLQRDGDFPASARVVNELRVMTSDPKTTASQVTETILREPSLGTRVLSLVNSSFYRRAKPIMTVSQAVVQIGMRPLSELCAGLILLQKFIPAARSGGPFAQCLQKTILTSLLAKSIGSSSTATPMPAGRTTQQDEQGYLAGTFFELGTLLLAYYFPKIYESALSRSRSKNVSISQGIMEITGISAAQLSLEVLTALQMPPFYNEAISTAVGYADGTIPAPKPSKAIPASAPANVAKSLVAAQEISEVIVASKNKGDLDKVLQQLSKKLHIEDKVLGSTIGALPAMFKDHCSVLELHLPTLPEYVTSYTGSNEPAVATTDAAAAQKEQFAKFVEEIREAVENREPTASIITRVMETLAWSLNFNRVMLLLLDGSKKKLLGRMGLGDLGTINPKTIERVLGGGAGRYAPDVVAFSESRPVFNGDSLLPDGWPMMVMPIGFGQRAIGVIYADKVNSTTDELSPQEQAAIQVLTELVDRSISVNAEYERRV